MSKNTWGRAGPTFVDLVLGVVRPIWATVIGRELRMYGRRGGQSILFCSIFSDEHFDSDITIIVLNHRLIGK